MQQSVALFYHLRNQVCSVDVPVYYEIPRTAVTEAIVNAIAHRDYTSNGSLQVMLFRNRLEVWNPGQLQLMEKLELKHRPTFIYTYIQPAIDNKWIEMTISENPTSPEQKYRLTAKGKALQQQLKNKKK